MSYIEFVAGCNAGILGVLVGHPFDTIKVKLQTDSTRSVHHLLRQETTGSLYRGVSSPLLCLALINAIVFGAHAQCIQLYNEQEREQPLNQAKCGFVAGASQSIISAPMELIRSRMQTQTNPNPSASGLRSQLHQIVHQSSGIRSLYRGYALTFARDAPAFAAYFGSYECILRWMANQNHARSVASQSKQVNDHQSINVQSDDRPTNSQILIAGGLAGMFSWLVVYPVDVLKTQVQLGHGSNSIECVRNMYSNGGLSGVTKGLCRGLMTTLFRAFPVNAASFLAYDFTVRQF